MPHATSICETMEEFIKLHKEQLKASGVPEIYWKTLFHKLKMEVYDAGENFMIQQVQEVAEYDDDDEDEEDDSVNGNGENTVIGDGNHDNAESMETTETEEEEEVYTWQVVVVNKDGIKKKDRDSIYLVDHAWTYRVDQARRQLTEVPGLLTRMAALMDVDIDGKEKEKAVEGVMEASWRFNMTYNIDNAVLGSEDRSPIWYVLDEFGSRVQHADMPSVRMIPLFYAPTQLAYTIMWPLKDLKDGDEVTRDYTEGVTDMLTRRLRLLPWQPADMTHLSFDLQEPEESFFSKYRVNESLPNPDAEFCDLPRDRSIRVYSDMDQVINNLNDIRFEFVDSVEEADIIWSMKQMKDYQGLSENSPGCFVNQFPFEMVLTVKNLLAAICRRRANGKHINPDTLETSPDWLPVTFNLSTELAQFVSYFQHREKLGLMNTWICKPWNLARSLDSHITSNLDYIIRLPDTGPKIACLYVDDPVLIERENIGFVKFDLRFIVMLTSVQPLTILVHNKFILRYANVPYSMDHFDEYEKHFTVMKYKQGLEKYAVTCDDFIKSFEEQYPGFSWADRMVDVHRVIQEMFEAASSEPPPRGIAHSPQSRAMYGVDIMLKWNTNDKGERVMSPVLFECNYGPDNQSLIQDHPTLINDVFSALFLHDTEGHEVTLL